LNSPKIKSKKLLNIPFCFVFGCVSLEAIVGFSMLPESRELVGGVDEMLSFEGIADVVVGFDK
jgi:hypothetical protein